MVKKNLLITFFLGMLTLSVASLSFSFAWYASASRLLIDAVEISIDADKELFISTTKNKEDFVGHLDKSDLREVGSFVPVSSVFSDEWISKPLENPYPKFYDQSFPYTQKGEPDRHEAYLGYLSQDIYIDCKDDVYVTLDTKNTFITGNTEFIKQQMSELQNNNPSLSKEQIEENLNDLARSMRISILVPLMNAEDDYYQYYIIDPNKKVGDKPVEFGGVLDNMNQKDEHYYDSYVDSDGKSYETVYGDIVGNRRDLIKHKRIATTNNHMDKPGEERSAFNAIHKEGVYEFDKETSDTLAKKEGYEGIFERENSISLEELENHQKDITIPVYGRSVGPRRIVISIYIEGWDHAIVNEAAGCSFNLGLQFEINKI